MIVAPLPANEAERLAALDALDILHTPPEQVFDDVALVASHLCGTPMAMVSLVGQDEQWWKAHVGTEAEGTPREHAFCAHAILEPDAVLVVPDAAADPRFHDNPLVTGEPGVRFYAGAPLVAEHGVALGALCVADRVPRSVEPAQAAALRALARTVVTLMEERRLIESLEERALVQETRVCRLELARREACAEAARLAEAALVDPLTALPNRRALDDRLDEELARALRHQQALSLVLLDVDHFRAYNDRFGHPAGDDVLAILATLVRNRIRAEDIAFRYGGEEFAVLLPATSAEGATILAERIRRAVAGLAWPLAPVTVSVGIGTFGESGRSRDELLRVANAALFEAKRRGRNRVIAA